MDKIAVATDFSARSERAVQRAQLIARKTGAELVLIHIVDEDQPEEVIASSRSIATSVLGEMARRLEHEGAVATPLIGEGDIAGGILASADAVDADLIVVGPHRKRASDVFIGTTADRIVRRSERPVLVAVGSPSAHHHRTLLALDFDDASKEAGQVALELGVFDHTDVVVMHAFAPLGDGLMLRTVVPPSEVEDYRAAERVNTISSLHALLEELSLPVSTTRLVVMNGSPARAILESADREAADLIIVGTSQRKGFARLMVGSIAGDAIRDTQRDILVVPAAGLRLARKARVVLTAGRDLSGEPNSKTSSGRFDTQEQAHAGTIAARCISSRQGFGALGGGGRCVGPFRQRGFPRSRFSPPVRWRAIGRPVPSPRLRVVVDIQDTIARVKRDLADEAWSGGSVG